MNKFPKISIITPSFNQGRYIEETILSVLNQNYPNLEYIIIDGGSTDETVGIIKKYENQITYWVSEQDKGQSDAINKGLSRCTGDIINWLNSDDYLLDGALLSIAEKYQENESIHCVAGRSVIFEDGGDELFCNYGTWVDKSSLKETLRYLMIEQPATFFSSTAIKTMGNVNQELHYVMDKEWWLKFLLSFDLSSISILDKPVVNFRFQSNSKTVSESNSFSNDLATIYHSICTEKGMSKEAELLHQKFDINSKYAFDSKLCKNLSDADFHVMLRFFCFKNFSLVFNKQDFLYAKKCINLFDLDKMTDLNDRESVYLKRLVKNTSASNWLMFRLNRKIKTLSS